MTLLLLGMILFYGTHVVSALPLRAQLVARFGANPYKGLYSLASLVGLALMILGYGRMSGANGLWPLPLGLQPVAILLIVGGLYSIVGGNLGGNWRRYFRHPMSLGLILFCLGHLMVNSTLRDLLLFGSLAAYSAFNIWSANRRGPWDRPEERAPLLYDGIHMVVWLVVVIAIYLWLHGLLFGVALSA